MSFKNAIVLTGGIATGKSSVCKILKSNGYEIIDADKIAHVMLDKNSSKIADIFGTEYLKEDKVIRKKLGSLIFSDKEARQKLENLLHPLIKDEIEKQTKYFEKNKIPYIIDIPLFFEKGNYEIDKVITVYCTKEQQLQRLMLRDNMSENEAQKRVNAQMDINKKRELSTHVIENRKDFEHLRKEIEKIISITIPNQIR